jgi:hypothetical protein
MEIRRAASATALAAPKARAARGFAHSTRLPSSENSHAGSGLVACIASRGSATPRNWNSEMLIAIS